MNETEREYQEKFDKELEKLRKETRKYINREEKRINKKFKQIGKRKKITKAIQKICGIIVIPAFCMEIGCFIPSMVLHFKYQDKMDNLIQSVQFEEAQKQYEIDTKMAIFEDYQDGKIDEETFLYETEHFVPLELDNYMASDAVSKEDYADYQKYKDKLEIEEKLENATRAGVLISSSAVLGYSIASLVDTKKDKKIEEESTIGRI